MTTLAPGYGKQVSELACDLDDFGASVLQHVETAELDLLRHAVDSMAYQIRVAERELCIVDMDRRRLVDECHGYERTLEMVSKSDPADDALILRVMQRIADRREQILDLSADAAFLQERMKTLSADLRGTHSATIEALETCIEYAADTKRRAVVRQRRREIQRAGTAISSASDPMWSPVALVGYRTWDMKPDGMYGAWKQWTAPQFDAACSRGAGVPHTDGQCDRIAFGCGVYSAKNPTQLMRSYGLGPSIRFAIGLVALEGRVVEHDDGYRAEHVRVAALITVDETSVRSIEDPEELVRVFQKPAARSRLGSKVAISRSDPNRFRKAIAEHFKEREPGDTPWT